MSTKINDVTEALPEDLKEYLGSFGPQAYDAYCGEPVGWGYKIVKHCGDEIWSRLSKFGEQVCLHGSYDTTWVLITRKLSREEAETLYGSVTNEEFGPRGGWKSVTFGDKKFASNYLRPEK